MKIKIGTRKSALAMSQTNIILDLLKSEFPDLNFEIVPIVTKGDKVLDRPLIKIGGKGIFIKEIESALLNGEIDIAVHSAKDLPVSLPENLEISAVPERKKTMGFVEDSLVFPEGKEYKKTDRFIIGTGSSRRKFQLKLLYPNAEFKEIRGNVGTRIDKMLKGEYDALALSYAGLMRLKIENEKPISIKILDKFDVVPAPCQGLIAVETRKGSEVGRIVAKINDSDTMLEFALMREVSRKLDADCTDPLADLAEINGEKMNFYFRSENGLQCFNYPKNSLRDLIYNVCQDLGREWNG